MVKAKAKPGLQESVKCNLYKRPFICLFVCLLVKNFG